MSSSHTFITRPTNIFYQLGGLSLSLLLVSSCDSLWSSFVMDDPTSCASPNSQVTCQSPRVCNPNNGKCETTTTPPLEPLQFTSINPTSLPMAGGVVDLFGRGLTGDTKFTIDTGAVTATVATPDGTKLNGTAPRAPKVCVPLKITLQRGSEPAYTTPQPVFSYRFEPFTIQSLVLFGAVDSSKINQLFLSQIDADNRLDLVIGHSNGIKVVYSADGISAVNTASLARTGGYEKLRIGKLTGLINSDIIGMQGKTVDIVSCTAPGGNCTVGPTANTPGGIRDAFVEDVLNAAGNELIVLDSNAASPGEVGVFNFGNGTLTGPLIVYNATEELIAASVADLDLNGQNETLFLVSPTKLYKLPFGNRMGGMWSTVALNSFVGSYGTPAFGNLDGDGLADLVVFSPNKGAVLVATGKSNFSSISAYQVPNLPAGGVGPLAIDVQLTDVNCDGKNDIVVSTHDTGFGPYFYINDGTGNFGTVPSAPNGNGMQVSPGGPIIVYDLNGDSVPDILMRPPGATPQGLYFGRGKFP